MMTVRSSGNHPESIAPYDLDFPTLRALLKDWGEPSYRAEQLWRWLYVHLAGAYEEMTNLPRELRRKLAERTTLRLLEVIDSAQTEDGRTRKHLLRLRDGETIEAVLMHYEERRTACLSTQVGCAIGCPFCATGQMGLRRDLSSGEIIAQALHFARRLCRDEDRLTNVVLMGMGEPLANYDNSLAAIRRLNHPQGFQLGQRHITLSTVGLVPEIHRLAREGLQITLAVSLHAATDELRDQLVPVNRRYGLDALFEACTGYTDQTHRRVTFEWAVVQDVNDTAEQAHALADRIYSSWSARGRSPLPHVNLIPLNPSPGYPGGPASSQAIETFTAVLDRRSISYTVRVRRGAAIQAGCGQLRQREAPP